jgi:hypothetical protein
MLRAIRRFSLLLLLETGITLFSAQAGAQALNSAGVRWDSTNQVLFFEPGLPGLVVRSHADGAGRRAEIDISKDFAGLQNVYVDSVTAAPEGTTLIAATLSFRNYTAQSMILTYDSSGQLLKTWDTMSQQVEAIAYSRDDDAVFVLGEGGAPNGPNAPLDPLLVEYSRDGRVLKSLIPAGMLRDGGDSLRASSQVGEPALRITKNRIYFYAPKNRETCIIERTKVGFAYWDISEVVADLSTEDGYHLVQTHHVDFSDDGDIVLELLLGNDSSHSYVLDLVRLNIETGEGASVHKSFNDARLWFVGIENGKYLYLADGKDLYIQPSAAQEPAPLDTKQLD